MKIISLWNWLLSCPTSWTIFRTPGGEFERLGLIRELCRRHGDQVALAMKRMRDSHDDLYSTVARDSLIGLISDRQYLKDPVSL